MQPVSVGDAEGRDRGRGQGVHRFGGGVAGWTVGQVVRGSADVVVEHRQHERSAVIARRPCSGLVVGVARASLIGHPAQQARRELTAPERGGALDARLEGDVLQIDDAVEPLLWHVRPSPAPHEAPIMVLARTPVLLYCRTLPWRVRPQDRLPRVVRGGP